jgi:hypothetical protein
MDAAPLYAQAVVGYRQWLAKPSGRLRSMGVGQTIWEPELMHARCLLDPTAHDTPAPTTECECGLYAWHDAEMVEPYTGSPLVSGAVLAAGRLEVHADGFRAERMQILALALPAYATTAQARTIRRASEIYSVPTVRSIAALKRLALSYAEPVPRELRPYQPGDGWLLRHLPRSWIDLFGLHGAKVRMR